MMQIEGFMTGVLLWIPAFAGMTKKDQSPRSHGFPPFPQRFPRHFRKGLPVIPAKVSPPFPQRSPPPFPQNTPRHSRKTLPVILAKVSPPFPQRSPRHFRKTPRHSREGGNPLGITVIHTGILFLNQPSLPCLVPFFQALLCRAFHWVCWP